MMRISRMIQRELSFRAWDVLDLICLSGLEPEVVRMLIAGRHRVTPEIAEGLAGAFGTDVSMWLH